MSVKLRKIGNSAVITLPKKIQEQLQLTMGDQVDFVIEEEKVSLVKTKKEFDLDKELNRVLDQYHQALKGLSDK